MYQAVLRPHIKTHCLNSQTVLGQGPVISLLQMEELNHREIKLSDQVHTVHDIEELGFESLDM
jgi:hypothetical protein